MDLVPLNDMLSISTTSIRSLISSYQDYPAPSSVMPVKDRAIIQVLEHIKSCLQVNPLTVKEDFEQELKLIIDISNLANRILVDRPKPRRAIPIQVVSSTVNPVFDDVDASISSQKRNYLDLTANFIDHETLGNLECIENSEHILNDFTVCNYEENNLQANLYSARQVYRDYLSAVREIKSRNQVQILRILKEQLFDNDSICDFDNLTDEEDADTSDIEESDKYSNLEAEEDNEENTINDYPSSASLLDHAIQSITKKWQEAQLPRLQATATKLWLACKNFLERHEKSNQFAIREKYLSKRLEKLKNEVIKTFPVHVKNIVEFNRQTQSLECTVFDILTIQFKQSVLNDFKPPAFKNSSTVDISGHQSKVSKTNDSIIESHNIIESVSGLNEFINIDTYEQDIRPKPPHMVKKNSDHEKLFISDIKSNLNGIPSCSEVNLFDGRRVVNPSKSDEEEFIYISSKASKFVKPHQLEGIQFLWREVVKEEDISSNPGCLLSHVMGLGKTFQVITLLATIVENARLGSQNVKRQIPTDLHEPHILIICPPSLVLNWKNEFRKWLPMEAWKGMYIGKIHTVTSTMSGSERNNKIRNWGKIPGVLIIGFHMFSKAMTWNENETKENKDLREKLCQTPDIIIVDEAHNIKNLHTSTSKHVRNIKTKRRIALTGTPLSNNLQEYFSMIDFVSPGYLGTIKEFTDRYASPIEAGTYLDSTPYEIRLAAIRLRALNQVVDSKAHRRDVAVIKNDIPACKEYVIKFRLTDDQIAVYNQYIKLYVHGKLSKFNCHFAIVYDLIRLCNHPAILKQALENRLEKESKDNETQNHNDVRPICDKVSLISALNVKTMSTKMITLKVIVTASISLKEKVLIFSHSLDTLQFIGDLLENEGISCLSITGKDESSDRSLLIDRFHRKDGPSVLLLSTGAGGEGTNLQVASRIIIVDFKFNPAKEEQAIGRSYRLGQTKPVYVYRLVTEGTIESGLLDLGIYKTQLAIKVNEKKNARNIAPKKLKDTLKFTPSKGSIPILTQFTSDIMMDPVMRHIQLLHNKDPFITKLESTAIYRQFEEPTLTEQENEEIKQLVEEDRLRMMK